MPRDQNRIERIELPPGVFFDNIRAFEALSQTLARQAKDLREAETLSRTNQALTKRIEEQEKTIKLKEQQIREKEQQIGEKDTANKLYIQGFTEETERGAKIKEDLKKEVASAEAKLKKQEAASAEKLDAAARKIQAAQDKEREKDKALKIKERSLQGFQSQLQESQEQLEALKDGIGMLDLNYNDVSNQFRKLASELHNLAKTYASIDLPEEEYMGLFARLIGSSFLNCMPGAIPISGSLESRLLRACAMEAIITKSLTKHIFRPLFPWSGPSDSPIGIMDHLLEAFQPNPQKEVAFRALIYSTAIADHHSQKRNAIRLVLQEVIAICAPLLRVPGQEQEVAFRNDLESFVSTAIDIWCKAQRGNHKLNVLSEVLAGSQGWGVYGEHDDGSDLGLTDGPLSERPVKVLFPQVFYRTDDEVVRLHDGCVLWSDQKLYTSGVAEALSQSTRINPESRSSIRRQSVSNPSRQSTHKRKTSNPQSSHSSTHVNGG